MDYVILSESNEFTYFILKLTGKTKNDHRKKWKTQRQTANLNHFKSFSMTKKFC